MRKLMLVMAVAALTAGAAARDEFYTRGLFSAGWTPFQFILLPDLQLFDSKTDVYGLSLSCTANIGRNRMYGWSLSPLNARMGESRGLELGAVNVSALCSSKISMALLNIAEPYRGQTPVQLGLVNVTDHGWQFGIFNYNKKAWLPFMMFFNYAPTPEPLDEDEFTNGEREEDE